MGLQRKGSTLTSHNNILPEMIPSTRSMMEMFPCQRLSMINLFRRIVKMEESQSFCPIESTKVLFPKETRRSNTASIKRSCRTRQSNRKYLSNEKYGSTPPVSKRKMYPRRKSNKCTASEKKKMKESQSLRHSKESDVWSNTASEMIESTKVRNEKRKENGGE